MCGIVAKYYIDKSRFNSTDLRGMMQSIYHRGPDETGSFEDGRAALGFQRLSIIDTASGNQPLYNEAKDIVVLANGEIYNFRDLRRLLESKSHRFRTKSDCEVIVHLYEEYGEDFISRLNGMFAFCLYDTRNETLLVARDRMGIKPFYFYEHDKCFVFGSEIKGILASKDVARKPEEGVLDEYLIFRSLADSRTFFSGVKVLKPGTCMVLSPEGSRTSTYWNADIIHPLQKASEAVERIAETMRNSVERQMVSDVPLGTLLSGGVDSSWVSALAGIKNEGLKTFTVGFEEEAYDETPQARLLADTYNLDYHELKIGNKEFADTLPLAIHYHDEPLNHANSVQIYLICKYAKQYVKVLLTGEGADELFGGYPRYYICNLGDRFERLSKPMQRIIPHLLNILPFRKIRKLKDSFGMTPRDLVLWNAAFNKNKVVAWLLDKEKPDIQNRSKMLDENWKAHLTTMDNLLLFERMAYLHGILIRQDKMSMAASIESRVPILDNEMIDLADSISTDVKIRNLQPKHLFKLAATQIVPRQIVYKKKVGFGVPMASWLRDSRGMGRYCDFLIESSDRIEGLNRKKLEGLVKQHQSGAADNDDILWPLINYSLWYAANFN
jgi:asparagine synthase (glutamine-hydrolysing)